MSSNYKQERISTFSICLLLTLTFLKPISFCKNTPEQIHLAYGVNPTIMTVTWTTFNVTLSAFAIYKTNGLPSYVSNATVTKFVDGGTAKQVRYIFRAELKYLIPHYTYEYNVGCSRWRSATYKFVAQPNSEKWQPRFVIIGDLGRENSQSLPRLLEDTRKNMYDVMLHVGDIAYDLSKDNGTVGDEFLNSIQPIAANIPYLTCPGNHEYLYNFSNYKHRFTMPNDEFGNLLYYSIDIGPVHLISINTEYMVYIYYGFQQIVRQFYWLEDDLKRANIPENRRQHPWIITMGHRPMYCSNNNTNLCTLHYNPIRTGVPFVHSLALEKLFYKYNVDLSIWAHEHSYERLWPIYNFKVMNGSYSEPYNNPPAPVHVTTGSAGNLEKLDGFKNKRPEWSAFRNSDYSYVRMKVFNSTRLYIECVSDDQGGKVIDSMVLVKERHVF